LGLSICKSLIEQMAGSVTFVSEQSVGTTFIVTFKTMCMAYDGDSSPSSRNKLNKSFSDASKYDDLTSLDNTSS
jgi:hypothetical protein